MGRLLLVSAGGAVGTAARYLMSVALARALGPELPYGTFAVNVIGSFLLGVVMHAGLDTAAPIPTARLVLGTGVLGGFTTYSAFNYETLRFLESGAWGTAALYVCATVVVCLAAGTLGMAVGRALAG
jgi:fluoride exporter